MTLRGIDVSHHQGAIDWGRVKAAGYVFAVAKATEGLTFKDSRIAANWVGMGQAGLIRGAYHFLRAEAGGVQQARRFVSVVGDPRGALAMVDVETHAVAGTIPSYLQVHAFVEEFKRLTGGHPILIYTGKYHWARLGNGDGAHLGPLWHAEYDTGSEVADGPELDSYGGWSKCLIWQWTSSGRVPGIAGNVDLNTFYGGEKDLLALTGIPGHVVIPPKPKEQDMKIVDCAGRPALFLGPEGIQRINSAQRKALSELVKVEAVVCNDLALYDALVSLIKPAAPGVDPVRLAAEISARLPAEQTIDQAVVEAGLRAVLEHGVG